MEMWWKYGYFVSIILDKRTVYKPATIGSYFNKNKNTGVFAKCIPINMEKYISYTPVHSNLFVSITQL
jgi:hypothetical protein